MRSSRILGLYFMAPAVLIVVFFFLSPVVMTALFSFTDMSTSTGVKGGDYLINRDTLRRLSDTDLAKPVLARVSSAEYVIDAAGLAKLADRFGAAVADEFKADFDGKVFKKRREVENALKQLPRHPIRKVRDRKVAADMFKTSVLDIRFPTESAFRDRLRGLDITGLEADIITEAAYTGWRWTSDTLKLLFSLPSTVQYALNTLFYVALTLSFNVVFGLFLAISTFYLPGGQATFFRTIWFLPRILPPVLYVLMWKWFTWDTGFISAILAPFGVAPKNWMLDTPAHAWTVIVLINGFVGASMGMILFSSAIKAIPPALLHASEVDGASRRQQVWYIILPQLRWPILFITAYQTLSLLTSFEYILLATNGGPGSMTEVWALAAYHSALNNYGGNLQYGLGAAFALILVAVGIVASLAYLRLFNFKALVSQPRIEG